MVKKLIFLLLLIVLSSNVLATTIEGTIYSFDLEKQTNAVITIDTIPPQTIVSKDGTYSFELEQGEYTLTAYYKEDDVVKESAVENIKVKQEGEFILDIILFPSFEDEEELLGQIEEKVETNILNDRIGIMTIIMFIISLSGLGFVVYLFFRYKKQLTKVSEEVEKTSKEVEKTKVPDESKEVIDFIKEQGGRTTQKEIRKKFPSSEAKISLIISELEDKKILKKIKKGRGNIIILN